MSLSITPDIEELHAAAVARGASTYKDPETGFTCFTEVLHLKRGTCCGNHCRHCPYGWEAVPNASRPALVASGDFDASQARLQELTGEHYKPIKPRTRRKRVKSPPVAADETESITSSDSSEQGEECNAESLDAKIEPKSSTINATTDKNVPYTRTGDKGTSMLGNGERRSKCDCNFEALGTVDELCSHVGVAHAQISNDEFDYGPLSDWLLDVMSRLFDIGSHVAKPHPPGGPFLADGVGGGLDPIHTEELETWINHMTEELPELMSFILPTGAPAAAQFHVCRTVCRRCERHLVSLGDTCDPNVLKYTNRLSDFLFTAARYVNLCQGRDEISYQRSQAHATQRERVVTKLVDERSDGGR